ncbi:MAG TPA: hypothetical protein PKZ70_04640 [Candidatus Atribacteria bacterium]|nr:hypothetical protein [Candidatus Atribacteria bacterium]
MLKEVWPVQAEKCIGSDELERGCYNCYIPPGKFGSGGTGLAKEVIALAFIRGRVLLPSDAPWVRRASQEYAYFGGEEKKERLLIPLSNAEVKVFMAESPDLITQTTSNEEGEFLLRVPPGEDYFLEFYSQSQLVALALVSSTEEEIDLGVVDSLTTAQALGMKMGEKTSSAFASQLAKEIEQMWVRGEGLEKLGTVNYSPYHSDPFELIEDLSFSFLSAGKTLIINWKSTQSVVARLYHRSFNSSYYRSVTAKQKRRGSFVLDVQEFEGYLFYLEVENSQHLLGRTPIRVVRAPLSPEKRKVVIRGREDGPVTVARRKISGEKIIFLPGGEEKVKLLLSRALERSFEAEMYFDFLGAEEVPRFLVREGFEELELALYFPAEFSFLWGPAGANPGVSISAEDREKILELWEDEDFTLPPGYLMEVGCSTPFVEVVGYRGGEYFHLFSNTDLEERIFLCSLRRLDSLDLETTIYYWGKLTLQGEGLFEDYFLELDLRGKFEEGEDPLFWTVHRGEVEGEVELWVNLEVKKK